MVSFGSVSVVPALVRCRFLLIRSHVACVSNHTKTGGRERRREREREGGRGRGGEREREGEREKEGEKRERRRAILAQAITCSKPHL